MRKRDQKGVALVIALIITLVVVVMIASTLYVIMRSTSMSGAGKRYQTASEAADGAVEIMKDSITLLINAEPESSLPFTISSPGSLASAVITSGSNVTVGLTLPATAGGSYQTTVTLQRLFTKELPGTGTQFPPENSGIGSQGLYFRINTNVMGSDGSHAETTALYRYVN